jgi:methylphosphotriester-DNA--protein-cysteine methyltransferase
MQYAEYPPDARLAGCVRCYWTLAGEAAPEGGMGPVLPDGQMELVFHYGDPFMRRLETGGHERQARALLAGQLTGPVHLQPTGRIGVIGVRFLPGGLYALLQHPQREFTNRIVPLADVSRDLADEILPPIEDARDDAARAAILDRALLRRFDRLVRRPGPVQTAVSAIVRSAGAATIDRVSAQCGVGTRQLERAFQEQVGISPKMLARIVRFQQVFQSVESGRPTPGAMLALTCGYYDQAHFVRDFKAFAGDTPASFLADPPLLSLLFARTRGS